LTARNAGTANARLQRFALKSTDGKSTLFEQPGLAYVLPGASRQWIVDNRNESTRANDAAAVVPGTYRLEGNTDRGAFATGLTVAAD
jgi:P pilus assembly chaperone PapD